MCLDLCAKCKRNESNSFHIPTRNQICLTPTYSLRTLCHWKQYIYSCMDGIAKLNFAQFFEEVPGEYWYQDVITNSTNHPKPTFLYFSYLGISGQWSNFAVKESMAMVIRITDPLRATSSAECYTPNSVYCDLASGIPCDRASDCHAPTKQDRELQWDVLPYFASHMCNKDPDSHGGISTRRDNLFHSLDWSSCYMLDKETGRCK